VNRSQETIARLIEGLGRGDRVAVDELFARVYDELKALAHRQRLRWRGDHTLNTTALVHEVYVKLIGQARIEAGGRAHFQALASRAMRHVLCNHARDRRTLKRGGGLEALPVDATGLERLGASVPDDMDGTEDLLCALDTALDELEALSVKSVVYL
jgi:RNA polymerase sigma factor (TIGR02999 family)